MSTTTGNYTEEMVQVGFGRVNVMKGGQGAPLLLFQDDLGSPGWLPFYDELARQFTLYVPEHPGFGKSERPAWMRNVRDLGIAHIWLLKVLGLESVPVVGIGFGGWVAAEMASMSQQQFRRMALVNTVGVQPTEGEIMDQFLLAGEEYVRACFHDPANFEKLYGAETTVDQREMWEINREMAVRVAWKPHMFNQALPHLLGHVETPTLVVFGGEDKVVPISCGQRYVDLMPNARLQVLAGGGHCLDVEKPTELAEIVTGFIQASSLHPNLVNEAG